MQMKRQTVKKDQKIVFYSQKAKKIGKQNQESGSKLPASFKFHEYKQSEATFYLQNNTYIA